MATSRVAQRIGGILTGESIESLGLIAPFEPTQRRASSYDLRVGEECVDSEGSSVYLDKKNYRIRIPSGATIIVSTLEKVRTNECIVGRFDLMIRHALKGLVLQVGTQIEPKWNGPLAGLVFNLSSSPVYLHYGEPLFTIEFSRMESRSKFTKAKSVSSLGEFLRNMKSVHVESTFERVLKEHKAQQLQMKFTLGVVIIGLLTLIGTLIALTFGLFSFKVYRSPEVKSQAIQGATVLPVKEKKAGSKSGSTGAAVVSGQPDPSGPATDSK